MTNITRLLRAVLEENRTSFSFSPSLELSKNGHLSLSPSNASCIIIEGSIRLFWDSPLITTDANPSNKLPLFLTSLTILLTAHNFSPRTSSNWSTSWGLQITTDRTHTRRVRQRLVPRSQVIFFCWFPFMRACVEASYSVVNFYSVSTSLSYLIARQLPFLLRETLTPSPHTTDN